MVHDPMSPSVTDVSASAARADDALAPLTVTVATARRISGLGNTTIWGLIKDQKLETVHIGRRTLITYRSLVVLLAPLSARSRPTKVQPDDC